MISPKLRFLNSLPCDEARWAREGFNSRVIDRKFGEITVAIKVIMYNSLSQ